MTTDTKLRLLRRANYLIHISDQAYEGGPWASTTFAVSNIQELPQSVSGHAVWQRIIPEAMMQAEKAKRIVKHVDTYRDFYVVPPEVEVTEDDYAKHAQEYHKLGLLSKVIDTSDVRGRDEAEGNSAIISGADSEADSQFGVEPPVETPCHIDD